MQILLKILVIATASIALTWVCSKCATAVGISLASFALGVGAMSLLNAIDEIGES